MVSISELYSDLMELINQKFHTKEEIETLLSDATSDLSTVATTGSYDDLSDKPNIPSKISDLTNDSNFLTSHQDISGKEDTSNKVTSLSSSSTDTQYPSAKVVYDSLNSKVDKNVGTFTELQAIIDNANNDDIIILNKDYRNTGNESAISITKKLNIDGNGHTLDANNSSGIISSTSPLSISDIVFMNANTSAILTSMSLYCYFCTFINNNVTGDGGAINTTGHIYIYNCGFINNSATETIGNSIYSTSTGSINDSFFIPMQYQVYTTSTNTKKIQVIDTNLPTTYNNVTTITYLNTGTSHSTSSTAIGVGTSTYYGHNKVINNLTTASYTDGESLSAYQGKVLNDKIDNLPTLNHTHEITDLEDVDTVQVIVTYTDNTTETLNLISYNPTIQNNGE